MLTATRKWLQLVVARHMPDNVLPAASFVLSQTAHIPAADLLYVNYNNLVEGLLPYSVVLDAARRCVVVAIRGSLSVEDCVTGVLTAAAAAAAARGAEALWLGYTTNCAGLQ